MKYRIAVASTDGKVVNQHFGRADTFYIVESESGTGTYAYRETRRLLPICEGGYHDDNNLLETVQQLKDCHYVLVSRIGYLAQLVLEQHGIGVFELPGLIPEVIPKMTAYIELRELCSQSIK